MKTKGIQVIAALATLFLFTAVISNDFFSGTWCIGDERLIITFSGKDSLAVNSLRDETVQGRGTYQIKDSILIATMINDEMELKMGYRFKEKDKRTIRTKIKFFTVDGDSVNHPRRWLRMERCDPKTFSFPEEEEE